MHNLENKKKNKVLLSVFSFNHFIETLKFFVKSLHPLFLLKIIFGPRQQKTKQKLHLKKLTFTLKYYINFNSNKKNH